MYYLSLVNYKVVHISLFMVVTKNKYDIIVLNKILVKEKR